MFFTLFLLIFSGKLLFAMADDLLYTKQRYPGVAQLVARQLWELDQRKMLRKKNIFRIFMPFLSGKSSKFEIAKFAILF